MAFSEQEKTSILFALGFSVFEDDGPAMRAINSLDSVEARARPVVQPILEQIAAIRKQIADAMPIALAIEDGSVKLRMHYTLATLRSMGREQVGQLAGFLAVKPKRDIFASGLAIGDSGDPSEPRRVATLDNSGGGCGGC